MHPTLSWNHFGGVSNYFRHIYNIWCCFNTTNLAGLDAWLSVFSNFIIDLTDFKRFEDWPSTVRRGDSMICRRHHPLSRGWLEAASLTGWLNLVFIRIFMFIALAKSIFFFFFFLFWCLNLWTGPGIARIFPPTLASSYFESVNFSDCVVGRGFLSWCKLHFMKNII